MKNLSVFLISLCLTLLQHSIAAQDFERIDPLRHAKENINFLSDANGRPFKSLRNFEEEGSPYFSADYIKSHIQMQNGKTYYNIPIKINQLTGEIIFKTSDDREMLVVNPFQRIELQFEGKTYVFRSGFPAIDKQNDMSAYQLLDSGTAILLKYTSVQYQDKQAYNSPNIIRSYSKKENHYIWTSSKGLVRIPKKEEEWAGFFGHHQTEMNNFIRKEHVKLKKEEDIVRMFHYYNQLLKQVSANNH
ncbi:hypothetical protein [Sediminibacterium sp.]|jgi:hypothetical protein|uniref:hypothetical protein n=1 Tax=Sediminibacterium sp. TaxID=1917865 RepID=UPI0025F6D2F8|nr:hypothetical protein [Sediminibacterium sp.]MBW0177114.1 hypothetical protein [Sediminibacterium sp.]